MVLGIIELLYNAGKDLRPQLAYSAFGKRTLEQYHFLSFVQPQHLSIDICIQSQQLCFL